MSKDRGKSFFLNYTFPFFDIGEMIRIKKKKKNSPFAITMKKKCVSLFGVYLNIAELCR